MVDEERVIGEVEAQRSRGECADGYFHTTCMLASRSRSRLLPRSAMSSLAPKYGEPAPGAPAVPKARYGRSIWTEATSAPLDSPPTIHAVTPVTATAAWDTGTWRWPAVSSRLVAGSKAQIVETVEVDDAEPPRPGARLRRAELGRAEAWDQRLRRGALAAGHEQFAVHGHRRRARQGLGEMADDGRRVPGGVDDLDGVDWWPLRAGDGLAAEHEDLPAERGDSRVAHRYRSAATVVNVRPFVVASTGASGRVPS